MAGAIADAVRLLKASKKTIALTGAGVSTESGIPDFRSRGGLWSRFDPMEYRTLKAFFLHGLDSSSKGTKGQWFAKHFPEMRVPGFEGDLATRLSALEKICSGCNDLILVGSSFGGLMATCFAIRHPARCHSLVLLAPALNFPEFSPPQEMISTPATLIIGNQDAVTPPESVLPLARKSFSQLQIFSYDDDHMLHTCFETLDWKQLLQKG